MKQFRISVDERLSKQWNGFSVMLVPEKLLSKWNGRELSVCFVLFQIPFIILNLSTAWVLMGMLIYASIRCKSAQSENSLIGETIIKMNVLRTSRTTRLFASTFQRSCHIIRPGVFCISTPRVFVCVCIMRTSYTYASDVKQITFTFVVSRLHLRLFLPFGLFSLENV